MEISASSTDSRDGSDNSEEMRRHHHHHHHHHHVEEKAAIEIDVNKLNGEDAAAVEIGVMASQKSEEFFTLDQEGQRKFLHDLFTGLSQQEHNKPLVEGIFEQAKRGTERKRKGDDDPCSDDEGGLEVPGKKRQKEAVVQPVLKELEDGKEAEGKGKKSCCLFPDMPNPWNILQSILKGLQTLQKDCNHPTTLANMCRQTTRAIKHTENAILAWRHQEQDNFQIEVSQCRGLVELIWKECYDPREMQFVPDAQVSVLRERVREILNLLAFFNNHLCSKAIKIFVDDVTF